jgi:hypothetical protein
VNLAGDKVCHRAVARSLKLAYVEPEEALSDF